jgi:hypothetical protein
MNGTSTTPALWRYQSISRGLSSVASHFLTIPSPFSNTAVATFCNYPAKSSNILTSSTGHGSARPIITLFFNLLVRGILSQRFWQQALADQLYAPGFATVGADFTIEPCLT